MKKVVLIFPLVLMLLTGCNNDLGFIIEYQNADGLKKGDAIVHEDKLIGLVEDIEYTDLGTVQVSVAIQEAYRKLATQSSLFYVNASSDTDSSKVIELVTNSVKGDQAIDDDQIIRGSDKVNGVVRGLSNQFGKALESFANTVQSTWDKLKNETLDQQIIFLEAELDKIVEKAKNLNENTKQYLESDVIPQINQRIDELRRQLGELDREDELEGIEKKLDKVEGYLQA